MTYGQGQIITAADYNSFINGSNQFNTVWGTGTGNAGYGQTAVGTVSSAGTITAAQWSDLITKLNIALTHQSGTGSGISSSITAGQTINYLSALATSINNSYTNRLTQNTAGSTTTGSALTTAWSSAATSNTVSTTVGARCAFVSGDAARYFFNAGGKLKFNVSAAANASSTGRTSEIVALAGFMGGILSFGQTTNGGRAGTGGTLGTNDTAKGYWNVTAATNTTLQTMTSTTSAYTTDTGTIYVNINGTQSNGGTGINVDFYVTFNSTSGSNGPGGSYSFDDSFAVNLTRSIDVTYPETASGLTSSWGTPTITAL